MAKKKITKKRKTSSSMSRRRKKSSPLPRIEVLIVLVFLASIIIWGVMKCDSARKVLEEQTLAVTQKGKIDSINNTAINAATTSTIATSTINQQQAAPPPIQQQQIQPTIYTRLYVTIDSLNLRRGPSRDSSSLGRLRLYDEVYFLNDVTPFKEKIFVEGTVENQPWFKIRNRQGLTGWVYGAGINFYKEERREEF